MGRHRLLVSLVAALAGGAVLAQAGPSARGQDGGMLRITLSPGAGVVLLDPALEFTQPGWALLDATCARLMTYPDKPAPASYRVEPEVAAHYEVSDDFKTYTFTLRRGFRFSDGTQVRASAFANAINRVLQPFINAPAAIHMQDIVGARRSGRQATTARGVVARGNKLVVRLHAPGARLPRTYRDAVLLRRPARSPVERGGDRPVPVGGAVLRGGVPRGRAGRDQTQQVLRRQPHRAPRWASRSTFEAGRRRT